MIMGQLIIVEFLIVLTIHLSSSGGTRQPAWTQPQGACKECHSDLLGHEQMHYPAEDACDICHEPTGASHPSADSLGFMLMDMVPALCYYCHEEPMQQSFTHLPHAKGECLACHDAHGSARPSLLHLPDPDLCLACHKRDYRTDSTETMNIRRLVRGEMRAHSAIELDGCLSCHLPHSSEFRVLLSDHYPGEDYLPALPENFALCFLCHDIDLLEARETEWGTGFRNGTTNLHWLHINGNKGRNCRMCHNIHGAKAPFLMEERVDFGQWEMRINFIPEEQGGSCFPGCHGKLSYLR